MRGRLDTYTAHYTEAVHYVTNGNRFARFTDEGTVEVWSEEMGWGFPVPADVVKLGLEWRACENPHLP